MIQVINNSNITKMSPEQHQLIVRARDLIKEARRMLDSAMYYTEPKMSEREFSRVREAYDALCSSNDLLP